MGVLTMTIDDAVPGHVQLRGNAAGADIQAIVDAAVGVLAACQAHLVVDLRGITSADAQLVALLNEVAARAAAVKKSVVVEVPDDDAEWLASASLHAAIRVERTSLLQVAGKARAARPLADRAVHEPADGTIRHEGRGFIASYGGGRLCASAGCSTTLSRYNSDTLCSLHNPRSGARRGNGHGAGDYI